nr:unnamed protein product [Trichobilharzia regenti]
MAVEFVSGTVKPVILQEALWGFQNLKDREHLIKATVFSTVFVLNTLLSVVVRQTSFWITYRLGARLRVSASGLIFKKVLRLNQKALAGSTTGQIINLLSIDIQSFELAFVFLHYIWMGILQAFVVFGLMARITVIPSLLAVGVIFLLIPMQSEFNRRYARTKFRIAKVTDHRVRILSDIIAGIRLIKFNVWENAFTKLVHSYRSKEAKLIMRARIFQAFRFSQLIFQIKLAMLVLIASALLLHKGEGDPEALKSYQIYALMSFITSLYYSITLFMPMAIEQLHLAYISCKRISAFLLLPETEGGHLPQIKDSSLTTIEFTDVYSQWQSDTRSYTLKDISFKASGHELIGVIGSVGSGKSSLLQTILGELPYLSGDIVRSGSVAYLPQVSWIFPGTIRENVISNLPFEPERYAAVLKVTSLDADLSRFPNGDKTYISERGGSLSGGQKARIALARVAYSRQQILLLDDPLAAVDARVSNHLFKECICDFMSDKLRLLVTHQHQLLPFMDKILILREGELIFFGTYSDLQARNLQLDDFVCSQTDQQKGNTTFKEENYNNLSDEIGVTFEGFNRQLSRSHRDYEPYRLDSCYAIAQSPSKLDDYVHDDMVFLSLPTIHKNSPGNSLPENRSYFRTSWRKKFRTLSTSKSVKSQEIDETNLNDEFTVVEDEMNNVNAYMGDIPEDALSDANGTGEKLRHGTVGWKTYLAFGRLSDSYFCVVFVLLMFIFTIVLFALFDVWLSRWIHIVDNRNTTSNSMPVNYSSNTGTWNLEDNFVNLYILLILTVLLVFFGASRTLLFFRQMTNVAKRLHVLMLKACLSTRILFFESNPSGRILNRFSKDIGQIDDYLPTNIHDFLQCLTLVINFSVVTIITSYWVIIPVVPLFIFFWLIRKRYIHMSRDIRRIEAVARSPVFSWVNVTLQGLPCLRAARNEFYHLDTFYDAVNSHTSVFYVNLAAALWLSVRLDILCTLFIASVLIICVAVGLLADISGANVGLMITYSSSLIGLFQWCVRQSAEVENQMVSVERAVEYVDLEPEITEPPELPPPDANWPAYGHIKFDNFGMRYGSTNNWALKNINLDIKPGSKVGIVGRTGAGKSSLISALFRLVEGEQGSVIIDNVDIKHLKLESLRKRISVIPQDPIMFTGTIRTNMDPLNEETDESLWNALERVNLDKTVRNLSGGLDAFISEGGSNFSTGQRQLLALARAILSGNRILVIDEATSNIDPGTDAVIQHTLRNVFKDCTVLTVAHRLRTVIDSEMLVVMEGGEVVESDHPHILLNPNLAKADKRDYELGIKNLPTSNDIQITSNGFLANLVKQCGPTESANLVQIARKSYIELLNRKND